MKALGPLLLATVVLLTGCASVTPETKQQLLQNDATAGHSNGRLILFRSESAQAILADAYIGNENGYFVQLGQNQYTDVSIAEGLHRLSVQAQGSISSDTPITVKSGETVCVEARPNHESIHLVVIPFLNVFVPSFVLEEAACPGAQQLAQYTKVG